MKYDERGGDRTLAAGLEGPGPGNQPARPSGSGQTEHSNGEPGNSLEEEEASVAVPVSRTHMVERCRGDVADRAGKGPRERGSTPRPTDQALCLELVHGLLSMTGVQKDVLAVIIGQVVATDTGIRLAHAVMTWDWAGIDTQARQLTAEHAKELKGILMSYKKKFVRAPSRGGFVGGESARRPALDSESDSSDTFESVATRPRTRALSGPGPVRPVSIGTANQLNRHDVAKHTHDQVQHRKETKREQTGAVRNAGSYVEAKARSRAIGEGHYDTVKDANSQSQSQSYMGERSRTHVRNIKRVGERTRTNPADHANSRVAPKEKRAGGVSGSTDTSGEEVEKGTSDPRTSDLSDDSAAVLPVARIEHHDAERDTVCEDNTARPPSESESSDATLSEEDWAYMRRLKKRLKLRRKRKRAKKNRKVRNRQQQKRVNPYCEGGNKEREGSKERVKDKQERAHGQALDPPAMTRRYGAPAVLPRTYKRPDQPEAKVATRTHRLPHTCHSESDEWPSLSSAGSGSDGERPAPSHPTRRQIMRAQHQCDWGWPSDRDKTIAEMQVNDKGPRTNSVKDDNEHSKDGGGAADNSEANCPPLEGGSDNGLNDSDTEGRHKSNQPWDLQPRGQRVQATRSLFRLIVDQHSHQMLYRLLRLPLVMLLLHSLTRKTSLQVMRP